MKANYNSIRNQEIKSQFVNREVIYCASVLVYELARKAEHFQDYEDELYGAFQGNPDCEEAATDEGWKKITVEPGEIIGYQDISETTLETIRRNDENFVKGEIDEETGKFIIEELSDAENWQELCDEQNIDAYEYAPEIYEHWIVTDWLANKLENRGHKVLRDFFGLTIWCRATTGQAISLDSVISEICEEMEILEGQKYEWK